MSKKSNLEIGKTYYPPKQQIIIKEMEVKGPGWRACHEGDEYIFEFVAARHGGGTDIHKITKHEFDSVKSGCLSYDDLLKKYDT